MVKLPLLEVLFIIKCGLLSFVQSQNVQISTRFMSGNVIFTWTPSNYSSYDVLITRDITKDRTWTRATDTQYTVRDVLLNDNITINVRTSGSATDNKMKYNVFKIITKVGDTVNLSWTAPFFPVAGLYIVYHTYRENRTIFGVSSSRVSYGGYNHSTKYTYLTRPFASTNIMFEIRDITLDDAGYYNGGTSAKAAWSGGGVVLIVFNKPSKPKIAGNLNVEVNDTITLTCSSQSTSAPDYYSKLLTLSHTWFVNETKIDRENRYTLRLKITKDLKYNKYTCTATEDDLESERSDPVQINPLYGPDTLIITPEPKLNINDKLTVREGEIIGPFVCTVDCNPPCNITWSVKGTDGFSDARSEMGTLLKQTVQRDMRLFRCEADRGDKTLKQSIQLDVQWSNWKVIGNVSDPGEGRLVYCDPGFLPPGQEYSFLIQSCNRINCSLLSAYIRVTVKDNLLENPSMELSGEVASRSCIIAISLVSILLGLTWFMVAVFVVYDRRCRNVHQKSKHGEESTQLQTQNMTQHYDDVQGTVVDQLEAQNMTQHYDDVQGRIDEGNYTDLKRRKTVAEGDNTELGQRDPETPYEELKE